MNIVSTTPGPNSAIPSLIVPLVMEAEMNTYVVQYKVNANPRQLVINRLIKAEDKEAALWAVCDSESIPHEWVINVDCIGV
jgi:hypothetical protein